MLGAAATTAASEIPGKDPRLIVHSADPCEIETPLALLREQAITPKELLFVRNNQTPPGGMSLEPLPLAGWKIEIVGLGRRPVQLDAEQLKALPATDCELVLQCSGNGRAMFSLAAPAEGSPWSTGAMGNVRMAGPTLANVLKLAGVEVATAVRFLTAEGSDPAVGDDADFEHSIPIADALAGAFLALRLNGELLPAVHGGPVRLVTPGFYGTMNVKWLSRLRLETHESNNRHQVARYRTPIERLTPGSEFRYAIDNSEPNWGMRTKSVIFSPLTGERLPAGELEVRGVAFNDGKAAIESVEVSIAGSDMWRIAELAKPASPYAWHHWRARLNAPAGKHIVMARATDALGRTQPLDGAVGWNPAGYAWSGVHRVAIEVG